MITSVKRAIAHSLQRHFPVGWLRFRIWRRDRHFEGEFFALGPLCDPDRLAVDIGGNAGEYAYWLSQHARRVITYEPNPECQAAITRLGRPNITLRPVALSDRAGIAVLTFQKGNSGIGSIARENPVSLRGTEPDHTSLDVISARLDDEGLEPVGLIKIDVEGHEAAVLRGALALISRDRPRLMIEIEERHHTGAHELVRDLLSPIGYHRFHRQGDRWLALPWTVDARQFQNTAPNTPGYLNNFLFLHETDMAAAHRGR